MVIEKGLAYAKQDKKQNGLVIWTQGSFYDYKIINENGKKIIEIKKQDGTSEKWAYSHKILVQQLFVTMKDMESE